MRFSELIANIRSDAFRYSGTISVSAMIKTYFRTPGFKYSTKMRFCKFCAEGNIVKIFFPVAYFGYRRAMVKYGIIIPYKTEIGQGFYIGHFGGIVVNANVVIGKNFNISQGVTIGEAGKNGEKLTPIIGDNVYIAPKATVVGGITIGDNACIGANAFVNKDIDAGVTAGGVPAKRISNNGSADYVHNIWTGKNKTTF